MGGHGFIQDQVHEATPARVGPDIGMQQSAQRLGTFKGDFALPDPFQYGITPLPVSDEPQVLLGEVDCKVELALFGNVFVNLVKAEYVFRFDNPGSHADNL